MVLNKTDKYLFASTLILSSIICIRCAQKPISTENRFSEQTEVNLTTDEKEKDEIYADPYQIKFQNKAYKQTIKTVLLFKKGWELSDPFITLGTNEQLELHFDELDSDFKTYFIKFFHYNKNLESSYLGELDYSIGFNELNIDNYDNSFNTKQAFTHYSTTFPNEDFQLTKSGNYLLVVYDRDSPETPILSRIFYVTENLLSIEPKIKYPSNLDNKYYQQEVDFNIKYPASIIDPYVNIHVIIEQNHRSDNAVHSLTPNFIKDNTLIYNYDEENVFNGTNEFRHLDLSNLRTPTDRVELLTKDDTANYVKVKPDEKRTYKKYLDIGDANGRFITKNIYGNEPYLESDYVHTSFSVPYPFPLDKGDLYLFGQLSDWQISDQFRLTYNKLTKSYESELYIKQAYYNYNYIYISDTTKKGDMSLIEGTHFDTENDYIFKVYYSDPSDFYDRLLLYQIVNSRKDF